MNGWETKTLGELCSKITDGTHLRPKYTETGIPFLSVKNLTQGVIDFGNTKFISEADHKSLTKRSKPEVQDILYTKVGTTGVAKVVDTDREFSIFVSIALLKLKHETIFNRYLEHFLNSKVGRDQARQRTRGMANKNLVIRDIKEIFVIYPTSLSEQKRIVEIVDQAFEGIDRAIANTKKNLTNAREVFESYLNAIFTQKGNGWEEKTLEEVCTLQRGFDLPKPLRQEGIYPLVSSSGVIDSHVEAKVKGPGVATGRSGSIGNVFYVAQDFWPLNTVLYVKDFHGNDVQFVYHFLKQFDLQKYAGGTGVPTLNRNNVHDVRVRIPDLISSQKKIVVELNELKAETQRIEDIYSQKLAALTELKQSILQEAFTGELTADTANQTTKKAEEAIAA